VEISNSEDMEVTAKNLSDEQIHGNKLLHDKIAVIFGAGGAIGSSVAREFSKEGATVFLSGRHLSPVETVANEIHAYRGKAEIAEVDALNEDAVNSYLEMIVNQAGKIDIVFNATGLRPNEFDSGKPAVEISFDNFMRYMNTYTASCFLTARAAARHMLTRHSGVVIFLTGALSKGVAPNFAGVGAAYGAIEALTRCLAVEWSPSGVRVVCINSGGMFDTNTIQQAYKSMGATKEAIWDNMKHDYLLKRMPVTEDTAKVAAFIASDRGNTFTGTIINATNGEVLD
jgi:3-oxoacyl-[acyl-carrier protein] reductase